MLAQLQAEKKETLANRHPPSLAAVETFVPGWIGRSVRLGFRLVDLWNEPDLMGFWAGSSDEYLAFMRTAYTTIKRADPQTRVMTGGLATLLSHNGHRLNPDLTRRIIVDGQDYYDLISLHEHGPFSRLQTAIDGPLKAMQVKLRSPKPLFFTETGMPVSSTTIESMRRQACELVKKIAFASARGAEGFLWFVLSKGGTFPGYNMIGRGDDPRPTIAAFNELAKVLRPRRFATEHQVGQGLWLLEFTGERDAALLAWDESAPSAGQPLFVRLPPGGTITGLDIMGNVRAVESDDGIAATAFAAEPAWLIVSGGRPTVIGAPVAVPERPAGPPGREAAGVARLRNPLDREAAFRLRWTLPDGRQLTDERTLPAAMAGESTVAILMPVVPPGAAAPAAKLAWELVGTRWRGELLVPLDVARLIPAARSDRPADFALQDETRIYNANENDPNREQWTWQGVEDLSARVWLGLDEKALEIRVVVADERHLQPYPASQAWQADSLQLAFGIPGRTGEWRLIAARSDNGASLLAVEAAPTGCDPAALIPSMLVTAFNDAGLDYRLRLPLSALGTDASALRRQVLPFNLLVNDDDGGGREGFCFIADGLGKAYEPKLWPTVIFE